jgi:hypothetical protein
MSSNTQLMSVSPLVSNFVLAIIKSYRLGKISCDAKVCIHADMVPKVSEKVMHASLREKIIPPKKEEPPRTLEINKLAEPIHLHERRPMRQTLRPIPPKIQQVPLPSQQTPPLAPVQDKSVGIVSGYGKLDGLFADPSVSSIECPGPGKPVMIIRAGQRQFTKISLNPKEIQELLEQVADDARIPLMEGVFRAAVDNFSINAVVSEIIGSRFIIKKQTPYALLE